MFSDEITFHEQGKVTWDSHYKPPVLLGVLFLQMIRNEGVRVRRDKNLKTTLAFPIEMIEGQLFLTVMEMQLSMLYDLPNSMVMHLEVDPKLCKQGTHSDGDYRNLKVLRNEKYKIILHRAVVNCEKERIAIPTFYCQM
ncbi:hypothetical protein L6452_41520 [Arctium lappa]|uniref:Uncharacterized protein n=1 Tax=Arctium lappa TaxID=4217 RepID=A0ACB8XQ82_ARCLA|nr:hypothetical protein L6452_41520 [Arctium lappa]